MVQQQLAPQGYLVDNEGFIYFPVLGKLYIKRMTLAQLRADLEKRLLAYLADPFVSIKQLNFNITVLGQVKKPVNIQILLIKLLCYKP